MTLAKRLLFILVLPVITGAQAALPPQLAPPLDELTIYSGAAITMGASSFVGGNIMVEAAATLGASTIVGGYIVSGAAVTLGATASVGGYITARDAGTIGADSTIGGSLTTGDAATLGANTIDGNIMVDGDLTAGAAILVGTKAVITGNLHSGAAASVDLGADAIVGGSAIAGTALTLGADAIVSGHAQAGTGAVALGVDAAVAGNARAGTSVTLAAGASVGGNITPGSIEQFTNDPKEPIDDQSPQLLQLQAELAAMIAPATNQLPTAMTISTTLTKGVYHTTAITTTAGITLTFDGEGVEGHWLINSDSFIAFGASTIIKLLNVTDNSTITWNAGSYTEVGASAELVGTFFAGSYILTGASTELKGISDCGGMFTTTGAVTLGASNIIGTDGCADSPAGPDHFKIDHDGNAINCLAEEITISAHKADHTVETGYTGTITLSTDTGNGDWSYVRGGNADNLTNQNNGAATYIFGDTESGSVILGLTNTVAETIDIDVKEDPISGLSEKSGEARDADDLPLVYKAAGFIFHDGSADKNDIGMQIAGKPSDTGYGAQLNLVIEAVNTDTETGACEAALTNDIEVKIGFECRSPSNCQRPLYLGSGSASELIPFTNANSTVNYEGVSLNFGGTDTGDSTANFVMNYPDAGQIRLHAEYTIDNTAPEPDIVLQGSSNDFVSRPFGFDLVVTDNQAATDSDGNVFRTAGDPFEVVTTAALWQAADDNDTEDGIPDNHNDTAAGIASRDDLNNSITLGDNNSYTGTPNFAEPLTLSSALFAPNAGSNPALAVTTAAWIGGVHTSNVRFDEVGIIEITARLTNEYLDIDGGSGMTETNKIASQSGYVGRFIPNSFTVEVTDSGQFVNSCTSGASAFTYIGETFGFDTPPAFTVTAWNAADPVSITTNYRGSYRKLDGTSITIADVTRDMTKEGTDNTPLNVEFIADNVKLTSPTTSENGTLDYTFGDDQFRYGPEDPNNADFGKMANSEVLPFDADIDLVLTQVVDGDAVETIFSPSITFDVTGNQLRFGQLQTGNVFGREIDDLKMSMVVKYLNASGFFVINTDDNNCTQIDTGDLDVTLTPSTSTSIVSITNTPNEAGRHVDITAPGNGNNDVVRVSPNLDTSVDKWLRYDWNNDGNFNNDPSSTATFGINEGNPVQIFMQQIYQ
jgi:predicted acyltransferase (DUF342 family)